MFLRILSVVLALLLCNEARAQDTVYVTRYSCPEKTAPNDPTIVIHSRMTRGCESGYLPAKRTVTDRMYGYRFTSWPLWKFPDETTRAIEPMPEDVYSTHRPCRIAHVDENGELEGEFMEWLLPKGKDCDGLPMGAYYRVYRADNTVCVRPHGGCMKVDQLIGPAQDRYRLTLDIAYANRK